MTVLRTDRKHASNCMTEENGVEKVKKRKNFFRSLRFRILIILIMLEHGTYAYPKTCLGEPIHNQQPYIPKPIFDELMEL